MGNNLERTGAQFETTEWTLLDELKCSDEARQQRAAEQLANRYWPPAYAWLRQRGVSAEEASECTQSFFHDVVLSRQLFEKADSSRGKLRDLLKIALRHYLIDFHRREKRHSHRSRYDSGSLEFEESWQAKSPAGTPDDAFDRRWALALLEQAIQECQQHFRTKRQSKYWSAFDLWILQPALYGNLPMTRTEIAQQCGFTDPGHVSFAVHTVKRRLIVILEQIIAQTVTDTANSKDEIQLVHAILT